LEIGGIKRSRKGGGVQLRNLTDFSIRLRRGVEKRLFGRGEVESIPDFVLNSLVAGRSRCETPVKSLLKQKEEKI